MKRKDKAGAPGTTDQTGIGQDFGMVKGSSSWGTTMETRDALYDMSLKQVLYNNWFVPINDKPTMAFVRSINRP